LLSDEVLAGVRHRAEEALATDGVERTHLGYEVLVKLKVDELLEQEYLSADVSENREHSEGTAAEPRQMPLGNEAVSLLYDGVALPHAYPHIKGDIDGHL
jgi:hypothetical protein